MRQAYDYWQDQPGLYNATAPARANGTNGGRGPSSRWLVAVSRKSTWTCSRRRNADAAMGESLHIWHWESKHKEQPKATHMCLQPSGHASTNALSIDSKSHQVVTWTEVFIEALVAPRKESMRHWDNRDTLRADWQGHEISENPLHVNPSPCDRGLLPFAKHENGYSAPTTEPIWAANPTHENRTQRAHLEPNRWQRTNKAWKCARMFLARANCRRMWVVARSKYRTTLR